MKRFIILLLLSLLLLPWAQAQISTPVPALIAPRPSVIVRGRHLLVDFSGQGHYVRLLVKSVGYSPFPWARHPSDWGYPPGDPRAGNPNFPANIFDDATILRNDFALLQAMKANTIRIWGGADNSDPLSLGDFRSN